MSGLGGLNKSAHGVVLGLVQLQLPVVQTPADLALKPRASALWWQRLAATRARWISLCFPNIRCTA